MFCMLHIEPDKEIGSDVTAIFVIVQPFISGANILIWYIIDISQVFPNEKASTLLKIWLLKGAKFWDNSLSFQSILALIQQK